MTRIIAPRAGLLALIITLAAPAFAQESPDAGAAPREQYQAPSLGDAPPGGLPPDENLRSGPSEEPLSAEAFDALTRGKTFDTYGADAGLYGIETFLSGKRVIWRDQEKCMHGNWEQVGPQICFYYEDHPDQPDCWTYFDREDWILGFFEGNEAYAPILLYPAEGLVTCETYLGT